MKILVCLGLAVVFAAPAEAQLFRRRYVCPPVQKEIITISPPPAPTTPEYQIMPVQQPMPVPVPMPSGGGKSGLNLGDMGLNVHLHGLFGQGGARTQPVGSGENNIMQTALILKMLEEKQKEDDTAKLLLLQALSQKKEEKEDEDSLKFMMLMQMLSDHRSEDADDSNEGDDTTIHALIQALVAKKDCREPVQIQPVPTPQPVQVQPVPQVPLQIQPTQPSVVVPQQPSASVSCADLLKMLMGNK